MILDIGDFRINLDNSFLQGFINMFHGTIINAVKAKLPQIKSMIQGEIDTLNTLIKSHTDTTFLLGLIDPLYPINMTMTHSPIVDGASNLITLSFDGRIYDTPEKMNHGKLPTVTPKRLDGDFSNSQQIFVHQSTLSSLFFALDEQFLPVEINNANLTKQLGGFFREIGQYYGEKSTTTIKLSLLADDGSFLSINKTTGFEIGKNGNATL